jgi:hypothetical protein
MIAYSRQKFIYVTDSDDEIIVTLNDYIGMAAGLVPYDSRKHWNAAYKCDLELRYLKLRSVEPQRHAKKIYKNLPINASHPLWTGDLGQRLYVDDVLMETFDRVDECKPLTKDASKNLEPHPIQAK